MFAYGITLFEAVFRLSPFIKGFADENDEAFGPFFNDDYMSFWKGKKQISDVIIDIKN